MKHYSMIRIGNEYIVQVGDKKVLKTASKRNAIRLISHAAELLEGQSPSASAADIIKMRTIAAENFEVS